MKRVIKTLFALSLLFVLVFCYGSLLTPVSNAETVPQLRLRLFEEARANHPDVWDGCDRECIDARIESAPFLVGLARQANVSLDDLARYAVVRSFDWGIRFEDVYGRPPTEHDWIYGYIDNAEALREELAASPVLTIINEWPPRYQLRGEYE